MRIMLTSTVKIKSETSSLLPVRTDKPILKSYLKTAMKKINSIELTPPVYIGEIIEEGFIEDDINLIATKTVEK